MRLDVTYSSFSLATSSNDSKDSLRSNAASRCICFCALRGDGMSSVGTTAVRIQA